MKKNSRINIWRIPTCLAFFCLMLAGNVASAGVWKFVYVADVQSGLTPSNAVNTNVCIHMARQIVRESPDLMLLPGDLVYGNTNVDVPTMLAEYVQWSNAFSAVYAAGIPIYPMRGNHEPTGDDTNATAYLTFFGASVPSNGPAGEVGLTYSFAHNNALFIGLDQYKHPHQVNQPWLDSQLASNRYAHTFVFGHEPAVQTDAPTCLAIENTQRDLFLKSITDAGCRMYLCGHDHLYNRGRLFPKSGGSIMQVVCGSGGAPFSTWDGIYGQDFHEQAMGSNCYYSAFTNGYVLVTVSNFNVKMEWKGSTNLATWQTYDTYSYQITNPAVRNVTDYDGDRRADLAIYSENQGRMIIAMSARNYFCSVLSIGGLGAVMAPGDYDGDGIADLAVYWKENGLWQISLSDQNYATVTNTLGETGYTPAPADYDGDGKTDLAVYQRSSGNWIINFSSTNGASITGYCGGPGYQPAPGDYDGDGRADIAVYRPSTGDWLMLLTAGQALGHYAFFSMNWGWPDFLAASADYDNDGRTDPALFNKSTGLFMAALSGSRYQTVYAVLDATNSIPVPGDYDGDGRADPMVYSRLETQWLAAMSASSYQSVTALYGGPDWMAVPNDPGATLVFLAFGDSITYGGGSSSDGPATAYPILLETKLKENYAGYFRSINSGNPGETTERGLERYAAVLYANNPDLVLIMEGTNDSFYGDPYDQIEDNLRAMVQYALALGINVIIATIPPVISNGYRNRDEQESRIVGFNPRIYKIAADYNIPVAPVFEAITAVPNWQNLLMDQPSANHPNDAGHAVIRDTFYVPISAELDSGEYY